MNGADDITIIISTFQKEVIFQGNQFFQVIGIGSRPFQQMAFVGLAFYAFCGPIGTVDEYRQSL